MSSASVSVGGERLGAVERGLLILVGVGRDDSDAQAAKLADKVANLRVFEDQDGRMDRSLLDVEGGALCVSQFTLYGDTRKGLRPSFTAAADPAAGERLYAAFCRELKTRGVPVETGRFGARMAVELVNDGPVTLLLEA